MYLRNRLGLHCNHHLLGHLLHCPPLLGIPLFLLKLYLGDSALVFMRQLLEQPGMYHRGSPSLHCQWICGLCSRILGVRMQLIPNLRFFCYLLHSLFTIFFYKGKEFWTEVMDLMRLADFSGNLWGAWHSPGLQCISLYSRWINDLELKISNFK